MSVNQTLVLDVMLRTCGHLYPSSYALVARCLGTGSGLHFTVTYFYVCLFVYLAVPGASRTVKSGLVG
jgi:hypothetical protein